MSHNRINDEQKMILESQRNSQFAISLKDLEDMVDNYKRRKYNEEILSLEELGGVQGLVESLRTSVEYGLTNDEIDKNKRIEAFGSNFREP